MPLGIFYALLALVGWALDDFFIGRTSKRIGALPALFFMSCFGMVILSPLAIPLIPQYLPLSLASIGVLLTLMIVTNIAALTDFEALRVGKLAAIDPLYGLEIPLTGVFAFIFLGESLSWGQIGLIGMIICGMCLVSAVSFRNIRMLRWERGVRLALISILFMGGTNFLTGFSARAYDPILTNWVSYLGLTIFCLILLIRSKQITALPQALSTAKWLVLGLGIADVLAWTSFAKSTTLTPIGITTAISEAYIALAVLLGVYLNKERLRTHQWVGICIIIAAITVLAVLTA